MLYSSRSTPLTAQFTSKTLILPRCKRNEAHRWFSFRHHSAIPTWYIAPPCHQHYSIFLVLQSPPLFKQSLLALTTGCTVTYFEVFSKIQNAATSKLKDSDNRCRETSRMAALSFSLLGRSNRAVASIRQYREVPCLQLRKSPEIVSLELKKCYQLIARCGRGIVYIGSSR